MKNIYLLSESKYLDVIHIPTIQIRFIQNSIILDKFDTLIFTSKNGVRALDRVWKDWKNIPAISVGRKTADEVLKLGGRNIFFSKKFYGDILAKDIVERFSTRKFLYVRPKTVASNLTETLKMHNIQIAESILYKTECRSFHTMFSNPIFIATSPSTLKCLLKKSIPDNAIFIAIGKTTFKEIPDKYQKFVAQNQTIESCISLAKKYFL